MRRAYWLGLRSNVMVESLKKHITYSFLGTLRHHENEMENDDSLRVCVVKSEFSSTIKNF